MQQTLTGFRIVSIGSLLGLGAIVFLKTSEAGFDQSVYEKTKRAKTELTAQTDLEKAQVEAAKNVADAHSKNQIAQFQQLIVNGYVLNKQPPQVDWARTVNPFQKTYVFDKNRKCIGYAHQGKFYFSLYYKGVCDK